jgi:extracellular factor (EF) 3-hydroxypalmitic acid methyl ester biosynthesis protein
MNHLTNENGRQKLSAKSIPELTQAQLGVTTFEISGTQVTFQTADGVLRRGIATLVRRHSIVFELFGTEGLPRFSESLQNFQVAGPDGTLYSGRAVVDNLVDDGIRVTYEVNLDESAWADSSFMRGGNGKPSARQRFGNFLHAWQRAYAVNQEYKAAIADLQTFMTQLRLWLHQSELAVSKEARSQQERIADEIVMELREPVITALNSLYEKFEVVSDNLHSGLPAHRAYARQQLHPLLLGSPFLHRTYTKPLGYAGDYEIMNMIVRNSLEGKSIFAKLINTHLLDQPPCHAVRNRVGYLKERIIEEASRMAIRGAGLKVFSIACGPAWEALNFVNEHPFSDMASIELLDFNEETLRHTEKKITDAVERHHRRTCIKVVKNSVQNLLRSKSRRVGEFDLIYCSGLYDYLSDSVCLALNRLFYDMLAPDGLLVVGNFGADTPGHNLMEHLMDWFLIYRSQVELLALAPESADPEYCRVRAESAGANLFLEARKPK